jgi:hypothetical protein
LTQEQFDTAQEFKLTKLDKMVGPENSTILIPWLNLSKEDILGEYEFDIEVGSTQPVNQETRKRDSVSLAQLFSGIPGLAQYIRPRAAAVDILDAFEKHDIEKFLKSEEEVQQQQQAAAQAATQSEIQTDMPKRQTDLAKTQIKSQTALAIEDSKATTARLTAALKRGKE